MPTTLPALDELRLHPLFNALKPEFSSAINGQLWLALSGGVDSVALLYLTAAMGLRPTVVHIHHGLQAQADDWLNLCQTHADRLGLDMVTAHLSLNTASEAHAREHRYRAIAERMQAGDTLLLGHHASDQAETLLMRLCRGTSVHGLAGMAKRTQSTLDDKPVTLWRPLLATVKTQLEAFAAAADMAFASDPSNHKTTADANLRAHLRAHVTPKLRERFSSLEQNVLRTADLMRESASILDEICDQDLQQCRLDTRVLSLAELGKLSSARRRAVLSSFMINAAHQRSARDKVLALDALVLDPPISGTAIWQHLGYDYRFFAGRLYQIPSSAASAEPPPQSLRLNSSSSPAGFTASGRLWQPKPKAASALSNDLLNEPLKLEQVVPGSSLRLLSRNGSRTVKKILQEQRIEPWLRSHCRILSVDQIPLGLLTPHEFLICHSPHVVDSGWTLCPSESQKLPEGDQSTSTD